jgi:lysozyme
MPDSEDWLPLAAKLIQKFEGCAKKIPSGLVVAYPDPASGGAPWTIGWGSTGADVRPGTVWTQAQCDARLLHDLVSVYGPEVAKFTRGHDTTPNEFAALVSFAYNVGCDDDADAIAEGLGDSTLLRLHNAGNKRAAADQFLKWNKARVRGKMVPMCGLTDRREAERELYLGEHA